MFRLTRFLLCLVLLAILYSGAPPPAASQDDFPPPGGSDSVPAMTEPADIPALELDGPGEAAEPVPGLVDLEEKATLERYRQENPAALLADPVYYSVAGSAFQPRNSAVKITYFGAGCIYATGSGGNTDNDAFTALVNLPDGAVILGMRFFGYDTSAALDMSVDLFTYDGAGHYTDHLDIVSSGAPGYFNTYTALTVPVTVDNASRATSLAWYQYGGGSATTLCGAQILYIPPYPPVFSSEPLAEGETLPQGIPEEQDMAASSDHYTFVAGHDFLPRYSSTAYAYAGGGCVRSSTGGMFVADADLPEEATLVGARLFYFDASPDFDIHFYTTRYNGTGSTFDILSMNNGTVSSGYGNSYQAFSAGYQVDQLNYSMVIQAELPAASNVYLCGAQLYWTLSAWSGSAGKAPIDSQENLDPAAPDSPDADQAAFETKFHYRNIAGVAFQPRHSDTAYSYLYGGCTRLTSGTILTADLQLPPGARLYGVRLYTYDTSTLNSQLFVAEYDGAGSFDEFLSGSNDSSMGFNQKYIYLATPHVVDTANSMALVWNGSGVYDSTIWLCGMRAYYSIERSYLTFLPLVVRE